MDLAKTQKKLLKIKITIIPVVVGLLGRGTNDLKKRVLKLKIREKDQDHPDCNIVKIIEESWRPGETLCQTNISENLTLPNGMIHLKRNNNTPL